MTVLLEVEDVGVRFGGLVALAHVSCRIAEGEMVALIGPNGAGKTTLLNVVAGALRPTSGIVRWRGAPVTGLGAHRMNAAGIARTFQAVELFANMSVLDNVVAGAVARGGSGLVGGMLGIGPATAARRRLEEHARELLTLVGLGERADDPATALPAGRQRLLGIARALATRPTLLVLDEPGAGLIEPEKAALAETVARIAAAGTTLLFVEHDMDFVRRLARRIIVLDRGRTIADGDPVVVQNDPRVIEAYLGRPLEGRRRPRAATPVRAGEPLLAIEGLSAGYRGVRAFERVSLEVRENEIVTVLGANGAGKSTLLRCIARLHRHDGGSVRLAGRDLEAVAADEAVARGIALAPEGRELFGSLTVQDNLMLGQFGALRRRGLLAMLRAQPDRAATAERTARVFELFPVLAERRDQLAGTLSGGQGQMLAIGRALMADPKLLMLDEPSLGIAPQLVREILATLDRLRGTGIAIILVEQNARAALEIADRGYVLASGRVIASGSAASLASDREIAGAYLGSVPAQMPA